MMKKTAIRESSIELLRILAVIGVVFLHYNNENRGGGFRFVAAGSPNMYFLYFTETLFICAVNVFVLISAYYLSTTGQRKFIKVVELLIQTIVFQLLFYAASILFTDVAFTKKGLLEALLPINYYVVLYLVLYLVSPYINLFINKLDKKAFQRLLILFFVLFSGWNIMVDVLENVYNRTLYGLSTIGMYGSQYGYTIVNFALLYLIGAYLRRYPVKFSRKKALLGWAISLVIVFITVNIERILNFSHYASWGYNNPFVILLAVFIFIFFLKTSFQNRVINELAKAVFTCYLFHNFFLPYLYVEEFAAKSLPLLILHQVACAVGLFLASYVVYKLYYLCSHWLIKLLTPVCNKVKISVEDR